MAKEWDIPTELQPDPADYSFDLDAVLSAVVGLRATAPSDAFTASALGTEREGSGVVIGDDGLLLTMGYLITEAETVWITSADGRATPGTRAGVRRGDGVRPGAAAGQAEPAEAGNWARARR